MDEQIIRPRVTSDVARRHGSAPLRAGRRTVLHVFGILNRGGAEQRTLEVIRALGDEDGLELVICTLSGERGSMAPDFEAAGAQVIPVALNHPSFVPSFLSVLHRLRVDVVHSHVHFSSGLILALAKVAGIPIRVAHFRSDSDGRSTTVARRLRNAALRMLIRQSATAVVGVAPGTLDSNWGSGWTRDPRFQVIPNGIDRRAYSATGTGLVRDELGIDTDVPLVTHIGRADIPTKNREFAIRVAGACRRAGYPIQLLFVGRDGASAADSDRQRGDWEELCAAEGVAATVRFLGERNDVSEILRSADALLMTSSREGLPGVILESIACGVPVVSSDVPGAVYIARHVSALRTIPLTADISTWVSGIQDAVALRRGGAKITLEDTPFDLAASVERYRALWRLV